MFATGLTQIEILATSKPADGSADDWWSKLAALKTRSIDVQLFSRQLYTLLKAGVPMMRGLAALQESATNKSFGLLIKHVRESLRDGVERGESIYVPQVCFACSSTNDCGWRTDGMEFHSDQSELARLKCSNKCKGETVSS